MFINILIVTSILSIHSNKISIACIGDSITKAIGATNPNRTFEALLQEYIPSYIVNNFGLKSSTALMNSTLS